MKLVEQLKALAGSYYVNGPRVTGSQVCAEAADAFRPLLAECWREAYRAHALDILAGDQVMPNPWEKP